MTARVPAHVFFLDSSPLQKEDPITIPRDPITLSNDDGGV